MDGLSESRILFTCVSVKWWTKYEMKQNCTNFPFHCTFSQTLDEVQGEVLKYVTVIATPLVLQGDDHPPTWTHAFKDYFSVIYCLVLTVAPIFTNSSNY